MANYKGHIVGGLAAGLAYAGAMTVVPVEHLAEYARLLSDWQALAAVFVIAMLFALFPDVDTNSKAQDIFFWLVFIVDVLLIWNGSFAAAAYLGLIAMLPILTHHRGWTHAKWAMVLVPLPVVLVPLLYSEKLLPIAVVYYGAAVMGYFSHLLLDGLIWKRFRIKN
ncbi:metal-dependent hydrolase [Candidatus Mycosynbacter amalyticus]|uniref:Metal-dependent hydrolase n=1 Tax=Candidatus Mycosynbacter amalyticus TaxID=2665156 RepID=A0A857MJ16_9BACT|nr:metal-dependent hydrolase [Candidatus Mycosynbacter amalyticus]QHN42533.1 metal-dependent hydrolase [Candidatus Mycosynbacter amalyticus]